MDYCIWSILHKEACSTTYKNLEDVKVSLKKKWAKIPQDTLCAAVVSFRHKLNQVIPS